MVGRHSPIINLIKTKTFIKRAIVFKAVVKGKPI